MPDDMFDKVKVIVRLFLITVVLAGVAAALKYSETVDWTGLGIFGPTIGLAVGTGLAALAAYVKKEFSGYGTPQNPQITKETP
jgi:hypothetical protein